MFQFLKKLFRKPQKFVKPFHRHTTPIGLGIHIQRTILFPNIKTMHLITDVLKGWLEHSVPPNLSHNRWEVYYSQNGQTKSRHSSFLPKIPYIWSAGVKVDNKTAVHTALAFLNGKFHLRQLRSHDSTRTVDTTFIKDLDFLLTQEVLGHLGFYVVHESTEFFDTDTKTYIHENFRIDYCGKQK